LFSLTLPARTALQPTLADRLLPGPSTGSQSVTKNLSANSDCLSAANLGGDHLQQSQVAAHPKHASIVEQIQPNEHTVQSGIRLVAIYL